MVHPEDLHLDFGLIAHSEAACQDPEIIATTLAAICTLVEAWQKREIFGSVAFTLTFPLEENSAYVSVLGHIADVCEWLNNPLCHPPTRKEELFLWCEKVSTFLASNFTPMDGTSPLIPIVAPFKGSLMQRRNIPNVKFEVASDGLLLNMNQNDLAQIPGLWNAMQQRLLIPAVRFIVKDSDCGHCGTNYRDCSCITTLDEGVSETITKIIATDAVWSNTNTVLSQGFPASRGPKK